MRNIFSFKESTNHSNKIERLDSLTSEKSDQKLTTAIENDEQIIEETHEKKKKKLTIKMVRIAYVVIILTSLVEQFATNSTSDLASYATSQFNSNGLTATASIVYKITAICAYPVLGKVADLLGRGEGFGISVLCYTICYILFSACKNIETYIASQIFYAIGRIGFKIYVLIFIADTTNLLDRGFWSTFPDAVSSIPSTYAGSYIQDAFLEHSTWRWGYGSFAIILAFSVIPLTCTMFYVDKIAKQAGMRREILIFQNLPDGTKFQKVKHVIFKEIDFIGFSLLLIGTVLFFLPFTITGSSAPYKWGQARTIVMIVIGFVALVLFCSWCYWFDKFKILKGRMPYIPLKAFKNKTILIAFCLICLDYIEVNIFSIYLSTTLQVAGYYTAGQSSRLIRAFRLSSEIACVITGAFMKYFKRTKLLVITGIPVMVLGHGLMVWFINRNGVMERTILLYVMQIFRGTGTALYTVPLQVAVQALAGVDGVAMSTSFFQAFTVIGALIGTAISGGMWNNITLGKLKDHLPESEVVNATKIFNSIKVAQSYAKGTETRTAISLAYRESLQILGWTSLGVLAPMLILMFFVTEVQLTEKQDVFGSNLLVDDASSSDEYSRDQLEEKIEKRKEYVFTQEKRTWKNFWRV